MRQVGQLRRISVEVNAMWREDVAGFTGPVEALTVMASDLVS